MYAITLLHPSFVRFSILSFEFIYFLEKLQLSYSKFRQFRDRTLAKT